MENKGFSRNEIITLTFFFLVSCFFQFLLSSSGNSLADFPRPELPYFYLPFLGFALVFIVNFLLKQFELKDNKLLFNASLFIIFVFTILPVLHLLIPLRAWVNPNYLLMPIVSFFIILFVIIYAKKTFETKNIMLWFPFGFFSLALIAFYINILFFNFVFGRTDVAIYVCISQNCSSIQQSIAAIYQAKGLQLVYIDFWNELRQTSFTYLMISGLCAWASLGLISLLKEKKLI